MPPERECHPTAIILLYSGRHVVKHAANIFEYILMPKLLFCCSIKPSGTQNIDLVSENRQVDLSSKSEDVLCYWEHLEMLFVLCHEKCMKFLLKSSEQHIVVYMQYEISVTAASDC